MPSRAARPSEGAGPQPAQAEAPLPPGVELTWLDLSVGDLEQDAALLDAAEAERARAFLRQDERAAFVRRRAALRRLVGARLAVAPADVRFGRSAAGRPFLRWPPAPELAFSTARSQDRAVIALVTEGGGGAVTAATGSAPAADGSGLGVGVDLERVKPLPFEQLATAAWGEAAAARILAAANPALAFYRAWTRHEATIKLLGARLADAPGALPGAVPATIHHALPGCPEGFVAALASAPRRALQSREGLAGGGDVT